MGSQNGSVRSGSIQNLVDSALDFLRENERKGKDSRGVILIETGEHRKISEEFKSRFGTNYRVLTMDRVAYEKVRNNGDRWYAIDLAWVENEISLGNVIEAQRGLVYD